MSDSGRAVEELVAGSVPLKYNLGFPASNGPTPETLKNYLDVSIACLHHFLCRITKKTIYQTSQFVTSVVFSDCH